jgi:hypothetical protein
MDWCRLFKAGPAAARGTIIALGLVTAGCATVGAPRTAEQNVVDRAQSKWDALVKGNIGAAYRYLSPGSRAVVSEQAFKDSIRPDFWKGAKVEKAVCAGPESCEAYATIEYEVRGGRIKTPLTETWIKQDGEWWFVQK